MHKKVPVGTFFNDYSKRLSIKVEIVVINYSTGTIQTFHANCR